MPNPLSSVKPRYKIRWSWVYNSWVVHEFYPAYTNSIIAVDSWQGCVEYLKKLGVW